MTPEALLLCMLIEGMPLPLTVAPADVAELC